MRIKNLFIIYTCIKIEIDKKRGCINVRNSFLQSIPLVTSTDYRYNITEHRCQLYFCCIRLHVSLALITATI